MYELARITGIRTDMEGTEMKVFVPKRNLINLVMDKRIRQAELRLDDGRVITSMQRRKAYATLRDMSDWTGYPPEQMKELMKYFYIEQTGEDYFSLSDCTVDTAREFITFLIEFSLEQGIQLTDLAINRTDDIGKYLYYCLKHKKCAVCGRDGEIHHVDTIGMGNDRKRVDDSEYRKICLCRQHHTEAHTIGMQTFEKKYKVYGIIDKEQRNGLEEVQQVWESKDDHRRNPV